MTTETQKHTPEPWEAIKGVIESDEMRCAVVAVRSEYSYLVATIENGAPGDFCDTEYANARLIAAAPEMLRCLEEFVGVLEPLSSQPKVNPWLNDAKKVIEKAKGPQS